MQSKFCWTCQKRLDTPMDGVHANCATCQRELDKADAWVQKLTDATREKVDGLTFTMVVDGQTRLLKKTDVHGHVVNLRVIEHAPVRSVNV